MPALNENPIASLLVLCPLALWSRLLLLLLLLMPQGVHFTEWWRIERQMSGAADRTYISRPKTLDLKSL